MILLSPCSSYLSWAFATPSTTLINVADTKSLSSMPTCYQGLQAPATVYGLEALPVALAHEERLNAGTEGRRRRNHTPRELERLGWRQGQGGGREVIPGSEGHPAGRVPGLAKRAMT